MCKDPAVAVAFELQDQDMEEMMNKDPSNAPFRRPYRLVIAVLIFLAPFATMVPYISPSVFMLDIMESFEVDYTLAGLSMTIQLASTGICFFIGSYFQDRLGIRNTIVLSFWAMAVGNLMVFFAANIYVFLLIRLAAGFGQGLYTVCMASYISTWFEGKENSYVITLNGASNGLFIALAYSVGRPLCSVFGSWKNVLGFYAVLIAVLAVVWTLFGKESPEGLDAWKQSREAARTRGAKSSVRMAAKEKEYWKILVFCGTFMVANTAIATFLPTYLTEVRMMEPTVATLVSSLNSILGIVGSVLGGIISAQMWRRKPVLIGSIALYILCGFGITLVDSSTVLTVLCLLAGALYYLPLTAQAALTIETKKPFNPAIVTGAMAITNGFGQLLTIVVSPLFSSVTAHAGMTAAYRIFFGLCIAGLAAAVLMKETGVRPQQSRR